ncbi:10339_t:CDS:2 [Gigaspora margarita]|uniref:10339_t:CDS:1 n=1 Tax=Gigaspora margarita TaxID=4874 RepID=A0ABN7VWD2_GIGMA|nr:10339_t:CDS:2 [Gigaspora margarita]
MSDPKDSAIASPEERRMSWDERKFNLIRLKTDYEKWKKLRISSLQRSIIAAVICIISLGLGVYFLFVKKSDSSDSQLKATTTFLGVGNLAAFGQSLLSLRELVINKSDKDSAEKTFDDYIINISKKNCPKKLDSLELSPLLFVKKLLEQDLVHKNEIDQSNNEVQEDNRLETLIYEIIKHIIRYFNNNVQKNVNEVYKKEETVLFLDKYPQIFDKYPQIIDISNTYSQETSTKGITNKSSVKLDKIIRLLDTMELNQFLEKFNIKIMDNEIKLEEKPNIKPTDNDEQLNDKIDNTEKLVDNLFNEIYSKTTDGDNKKKRFNMNDIEIMMREVLLKSMKILDEVKRYKNSTNSNDQEEPLIENMIYPLNKNIEELPVRTTIISLKDDITMKLYFNDKILLFENLQKLHDKKLGFLKKTSIYWITIILFPILFFINSLLIEIDNDKWRCIKSLFKSLSTGLFSLKLRRIEMNRKEKYIIKRLLSGLSMDSSQFV